MRPQRMAATAPFALLIVWVQRPLHQGDDVHYLGSRLTQATLDICIHGIELGRLELGVEIVHISAVPSQDRHQLIAY